MKKIILIGAGGHSASCCDVIMLTKKFRIIGFISDDHKKNDNYMGFKILGKLKDLNKFKKITKNLHIAFGSIYNQKKRQEIYIKLKKQGYKFPVIISPISYISKYSSVEEGTMVFHDVSINANTKIGKNCIINTKSNIEHDCVIEDNCHISTSANVNGHVKIGKNSFIGSGSIIKENKIISENSFIKMGHKIK